MKSKISLKGMFIVLAAVILSAGFLNYAVGDITFPNSFQNGTVADADQVNANFAAINARQSATLLKMAGTYDYRGSGIFLETVNGVQTNCPVSFYGFIVLNQSGSGTVTETDNDRCQGTVSGMGSVTVTINSANGSGTMTFSGGRVNSIQVSKDLNTMIASSTNSGNYTSSIAVRR
jgi:hypothetical protein